MLKTRTLIPDLGDRSDNKYYGYTSMLLEENPMFKAVIDNPVPYYEDGRTNANLIAQPLPIYGGSEQIESTTRSKRYFNSCTHLKYLSFCYPYLLLHYHPAYTYFGYYEPYWRIGSSSGPGDLGTVASQYTWADCDDIQRRAWWAMQPRWESEVSMLNFIWELKDFSRLFKTITSLSFANIRSKLSWLKFHIDKASQAKKELDSAKNIGSAATKALSDIWLFNQFAIQPLMNDIKEILKMLEATAQAAQAEFKSRGDFYQISHYTETLEEVFTGSWGSRGNSYIFTGKRLKSKFTATLEYSYDYEVRKGWDTIQRYWGLELNAGVIWEAIPFSFLVDYFIKVGDAIHNMALDPNVKTHMFQYCESFDTLVSVGVGFNTSSALIRKLYAPKTGYSEALGGFLPISGYSGEYYRRRVTSPNRGAAMPRFTLPSTIQKWNIAALIRGLLH